MKYTARDEDSRFRTPKYWKVVAAVICIVNILQLANGCEYNETLKCNSDGCSCARCLICPPGEGLYPQCGFPLNENMTMKCIPCKKGMYSDQSDFGSCHACDNCFGQKTLRKCTAKKNTLCKKGCEDGYQWDQIYHICEQVSSTTPASKEKTGTTPQKRKATQAPTLPYISPNTSSKYNASSPNEMTEPTIIPTNMMKQKTASPQKPTARPTADVLPSSGNNSTLNNTAPVINTMIEKIARTPYLVYILGTVLAFLFLVYVCFKERERIRRFIHSCCSCQRPDNQIKDPLETFEMITSGAPDEQREDMDVHPNISSHRPQDPEAGQDLEEIITSDPRRIDQNAISSPPKHRQGCSFQDTPRAHDEDPQRQDSGEIISSPSDHAALSSHPEQPGDDIKEVIEMLNVPNLLLKELPSDLKCDLSVKISKRQATRGWKEIGELFEVTRQKIEEFEARCSYGESKLPGEFLFEFLETSRPELTIKDLIGALIVIDRKDVISYILTYTW